MEKRHNKKLISPDVATLLLAGLITDTGSFQHANTSPRSLEVAAELLDLGGRQQEIVKNFFKTKKLSTLKLWGMILSRVQVDPIHRMVWSTISHEDLVESEAEPEETEGIIDDLLSNAPGAEIIFLIKQGKDYVSVSTRSTANGIDVSKLCAENGGGGHPRAAGFRIMGQRPFDQVVSEIVRKVREFQAKRLNIQPEDSRLQIADSRTTELSPTAAPQVPRVGAPKVQATTETSKIEVKTEPKPESEIGNRQSEKKVTYLDFPAKQENTSLKRESHVSSEKIEPKAEIKSVDAPTPKPAPIVEQPTLAVSAPEAKPESAVNASGDSRLRGNEKIGEILKPAQNLEQKIAQNVAKVASQQPVAPQKHHRKRHHKKPGGNPTAGKPANPPTI